MNYEIPPGLSIYIAAERAIQYARRANVVYVTTKFNGIPLTISSLSNADDIAEIYNLKCQIEKLQRGRQ